VIRLFRAFVGMKDDFYNRHITKNNLFENIIQIFQENGPKYNLLNSALIDLFEFIRKENVKHLIQHLVENYSIVFKQVNYVETFKLLLLKNDQYQELSGSETTATTISGESNKDHREEDEYFSSEDDQHQNGERPEKPFKPLVDYTEDSDLPMPVFPTKKSSVEEDQEIKPLAKKNKISINLKTTSFIPIQDEDPETAELDTKRRKVE